MLYLSLFLKINMNKKLHHPTHLWICDHKSAETQMILLLQKELCLYQSCQKCVICKQISNKEHPWVIWLTPERSYSLEQIDEILHATSFQLDEGEQRFFILQQAERLTDHCSNRLLKTIEEPSAGYNFFFLTDRPEFLPLTIQSRCVIKKFQSKIYETYKELLQPFIILRFHDPIGFIKQIDSLDIKEQESLTMIDDLYEHWTNQLKNELQSCQPHLFPIQKIIIVLQNAMNNPPMTGGTKIFWKNLYLTMDHATKVKKNTH